VRLSLLYLQSLEWREVGRTEEGRLWDLHNRKVRVVPLSVSLLEYKVEGSELRSTGRDQII